jgi:hypothetical protein
MPSRPDQPSLPFCALALSAFVEGAGFVRARTLGDEATFTASVDARRRHLVSAADWIEERERAAILAGFDATSLDWHSPAVQAATLTTTGRRTLLALAVGPDRLEAVWNDPAVRDRVELAMQSLNRPTPPETVGVPGAVALTTLELCLLMEDRGYRLAETLSLTRRYVRALLQSDPEKVGKRGGGKRADPLEEYRMVLTWRGLSPRNIERKVKAAREDLERRKERRERQRKN